MSFAVRIHKLVPLFVSCSNVTGSDSGPSFSGSVVSLTDPTPVIESGSGSYAYLYERISGDDCSCPSPTLENPAFVGEASDGDPNVSTWRLTVTDLNTQQVATTTFTVTLHWSNNL